MFNKKQYFATVLCAVFGFAIVFGVAYTITYLKHQQIQEPTVVVVKEEELAEVSVQSEPQVQETTIQTGTSIQVKLVDQEGQIISSTKINSQSLMGITQKELAKKFPTYEIEEFTAKKVILVKEQMQKIQEKYFLAVQDEWVGIFTVGEKEFFTSLHLQAKLFSRNTNHLLQQKEIEITKRQKQNLENNPYYIEQILENYTQ